MKTTLSPESPPRLFEFGRFRLDPTKRELRCSGEPVHLTPRVFDTLAFLVANRDRVLPKDELLATLWPGLVVEENNLNQAISKLRHALGETPGENRFIATVPGYGYRFVAQVDEVAPGEPLVQDLTGPSAAAADQPPARSRRLMPAWLLAAGLLLVALGAAGMLIGPRAPAPPAANGSSQPRTLAVLPFKPLVAELADPALELGVADSLIVKLAGVGSLSVRPLAAVRRFHDPATDPIVAGRDLRVEAVLDGHLQRVEDRIRVSVRLLRVVDGQQLWADEFDEPMTGIFALQEAISKRVVAALSLHLDAPMQQQLARRATTSAEAYERYLRGRFHLSLAQPPQAIAMFEQAIALDPDYAAAHAGLADILSRLPIATGAASAAPMERARALATRALELDPESAAAHAVLGWIGFYHDWDWPLSEAAYRRALALDPSDFSARLGYAHLLSNTRRAAEALRQVDLALEVDPLSPLAGTLKSQFLYHAGQLPEAWAQLEETLRAAPDFWIAHSLLGQLHLQEGRMTEALSAFDAVAGSRGGAMAQGMGAYARALSGEQAQARRTLAALQAASDPPVPAYVLAIVHLGLGERQAALAELERGYAERDVRMVFLGVSPTWDPLRDDPAFVDLLERMNLAPVAEFPGE